MTRYFCYGNRGRGPAPSRDASLSAQPAGFAGKRLRRVLLGLGALASILAWPAGAAKAGATATVKGTISLPASLRTGRRFVGHWRVENTNVAVQHGGMKGQTLVVLFGSQFQNVPPKNVSVEIAGLQATPPAVVISEGSQVEFKNSDKVAHDLSVPGHPEVMPPERLAAGTVRKQRFAAAGAYLVRCTEYPHLVVSVVVTGSPMYAIAEDKGAFKINDVPEGHATLKVWSNGRWVHEQEVDITSRGLDLSIKVAGTGPKDSTDEEK
jgi:plastocyanin